MKKAVLFIVLILIPCSAIAQEKEEEADITLSPGDVIEIRFFYTPDLNVVQTIRPDGKIVLQLVGEIRAEGKTPTQLTQELYTHYAKYLSQLDVAVFVQSFNSRFISVVGEVISPGSIPMPRPLTALEAIMLAGGINAESATYKNVVIIRKRDDKWIRIKINLENILLGRDDTMFYLQPLDMVYVPSGFTSM